MSGTYYIGLMSGTSMDGIDAVLVSFEPTLVLHHYYHHPIPDAVRSAAMHLSVTEDIDSCPEALDAIYGNLFAEAVEGLLYESNTSACQIVAIGCHGQTIAHRPEAGFSLQLGDLSIIAAKTGITTVGDFRTADIACGGQGAPLAPAFHADVFRSSETDRLILNLGGIANITWLPSKADEPILGWDTGPANALIDAWSYRFCRQPFDSNGDWARSGNVNSQLLCALCDHPYFRLPPPKSTGKGMFNLDWIDMHLQKLKLSIPARDVQRTLVSLTAETIAQDVLSIARYVEVFVCGGGVHNTFLLSCLQQLLGSNYPIASTSALGIPPTSVESLCFAWLARERLAGRPANIPSVTGARTKTLLGQIESSAVVNQH